MIQVCPVPFPAHIVGSRREVSALQALLHRPEECPFAIVVRAAGDSPPWVQETAARHNTGACLFEQGIGARYELQGRLGPWNGYWSHGLLLTNAPGMVSPLHSPGFSALKRATRGGQREGDELCHSAGAIARATLQSRWKAGRAVPFLVPLTRADALAVGNANDPEDV